jgi:membrane fusion protein, multidrug efflux system
MAKRKVTRQVTAFLVVTSCIGGVAAATVYRDRVGMMAHNAANGGLVAKLTPRAEAASEKTNAETAPVSALGAPIPVRVFHIGPDDQSQNMRSITGVVSARYETNMAFRVSGKIRRRYVEVGQMVRAGDVLFELEDEDYRLQEKAAAANLQVARANVVQTNADEKRQYQLLQSNAISPAEYERSFAAKDAAAGQQESATKQLELAANQISYCRLLTDVAGIVTTIDAETGQVVATGTRVCSIAQSRELEAIINIPENSLPAESQVTATVTFWSLPGVEAKATLREVSPVADPLTRTYRSRFSLIDPSPEIKLGMTASVKWCRNSACSKEISKTFAIPAGSIFQREGEPAVWIVDEKTGQISARKVALDRFTREQVVVKQGLESGDLIVSAGAHKLDDSQRVRIWERQE